MCLLCWLWEGLQAYGISCHLQLHVAGLGDVYKMQQPRKRGQWLVQARFDGLLTIMTPIWPDKENLALLLNQVRSRLSTCWAGAGWGIVPSTLQSACRCQKAVCREHVSSPATWQCGQDACRQSLQHASCHVTCSGVTVQLRSANQFLNMDSIKEWIFVTPQEKVPRLINFLEQELVALPCVLARKVLALSAVQCSCVWQDLWSAVPSEGALGTCTTWRSRWLNCPASQRAECHAMCSMTMPSQQGR